MPITITPAQPLDHLGPGIIVQAHSDLIGPIGTNWRYQFTFSSVAEPTSSQIISQVTVPSFGLHDVSYTLYAEPPTVRSVGAQVGNGDTVYLTVELVNASFVVEDSGTINKPWDSTVGLGYLINLVGDTASSGSFTSGDRSTIETGLTNILDSVTATLTTATGTVSQSLAQMFSRQTLDRLTLNEITDGPTGDPLHTTVGAFWYGVVVRITTVPDSLSPITPDVDWYPPDLAVLRIFRGTDLEYRKGIHSHTWMAPSPWKFGAEIFNLISVFGSDVPDCHVFVDWRRGVEGQVYLMSLP